MSGAQWVRVLDAEHLGRRRGFVVPALALRRSVQVGDFVLLALERKEYAAQFRKRRRKPLELGPGLVDYAWFEVVAVGRDLAGLNAMLGLERGWTRYGVAVVGRVVGASSFLAMQSGLTGAVFGLAAIKGLVRKGVGSWFSTVRAARRRIRWGRTIRAVS
jgi:hypothetical protein